MQAFYYTTTFFPVEYEERSSVQNGVETALPEKDPLPGSLLLNPDYEQHLALMGEEGWELINVQPLLKGVYEFDLVQQGGYGFGYSLTAGYYLFWKKGYERPQETAAEDDDEDRW